MSCFVTDDEPLFDAEELADLRADFRLMFSDQCQVMRLTSTREAGGGRIEAYLPHGRATRCRAWNGQSSSDLQEMLADDRITAVVTWRVILPFGTDVQASDRVLVTPFGGVQSLFEVVGSDAGASDALCILCLCKRIEGDV